MIYKPSIKAETQAEKDIWIDLIEYVREIGVIEATARLGVPVEVLQRTDTTTGDGYDIDLKSTTIQTEQQLIEACGVDTNKWEISFFQCSSWQQKEGGGQLYAVKAKFKKKTSDSLDRFLARIESGMVDSSLIDRKIKPLTATSETVAMINIYDVHLDKVTRMHETGEDMTIERKVQMFYDAVDYLLSNIGRPELIIFPVGNDLFNVNDARNTTKRGTPQETYISHIDAFEIGLKMIHSCIMKMASIARVYVPIIAGNHSEDLENILGVCLNSLWGHVEHVTIDSSRHERKYKSYGVNLFMLTHGDKVKIKDVPALIATEQPAMWANARNRYAIYGHIHHELIHELQGVTAIGLRSLSSQDKWHNAMGYLGKKTAYAHIFSKCGKFERVEKISF